MALPLYGSMALYFYAFYLDNELYPSTALQFYLLDNELLASMALCFYSSTVLQSHIFREWTLQIHIPRYWTVKHYGFTITHFYIYTTNELNESKIYMVIIT